MFIGIQLYALSDKARGDIGERKKDTEKLHFK